MTFEQKIHSIVKKIPRGKVLTYKEVAQKIGHPLAYRAVGNILGKNIDPKVPCHRVIRSDGKIGGYRDGTAFKIKRLTDEGYLSK
jgi:methylated-DNA-[protein]-cysteine S-methyltransferase